MGFRLRKSFKIGGARFTLSKSGLSSSFGNKYFRVGTSAKGRMRVSSRIPGTGISYSTSFGGVKGRRGRKSSQRTNNAPRQHRESNFSLSLTAVGIILLAIGIILTIAMIKEGAWGILIITIPLICIGYSMLPINLSDIFSHRNETEQHTVIKTENGWICPDCETENSNTSSTCKGCGRYK